MSVMKLRPEANQSNRDIVTSSLLTEKKMNNGNEKCKQITISKSQTYSNQTIKKIKEMLCHVHFLLTMSHTSFVRSLLTMSHTTSGPQSVQGV